MPFQGEMVHAAALSFPMQRRLVILRDAKKMSWEDIAADVTNRQGEHPCIQTVINYYGNILPRPWPHEDQVCKLRPPRLEIHT